MNLSRTCAFVARISVQRAVSPDNEIDADIYSAFFEQAEVVISAAQEFLGAAASGFIKITQGVKMRNWINIHTILRKATWLAEVLKQETRIERVKPTATFGRTPQRFQYFLALVLFAGTTFSALAQDAKLVSCLKILGAGMYNGILEDTCGFNGGVKDKLNAIYSNGGCRTLVPQTEVDRTASEVIEDTRKRYQSMGQSKFCEGNRSAYGALISQQTSPSPPTPTAPQNAYEQAQVDVGQLVISANLLLKKGDPRCDAYARNAIGPAMKMMERGEEARQRNGPADVIFKNASNLAKIGERMLSQSGCM